MIVLYSNKHEAKENVNLSGRDWTHCVFACRHQRRGSGDRPHESVGGREARREAHGEDRVLRSSRPRPGRHGHRADTGHQESGETL